MMSDRDPLPANRDAVITKAAQWQADQPYSSRPVPVLQERFGLTAAEACQAIGHANQMRACRGAFA